MKKSDRIAALVAGLPRAEGLDPRYAGWLACFNAGDYYEAHDVLEDLWLGIRETGDDLFYKGLIQLAGAFVHLRLHQASPAHPKHGGRLRPAARLFALALTNLAPFAPAHRRLDVAALCRLGEDYRLALEAGGFQRNPWHLESRPQVEFL